MFQVLGAVVQRSVGLVRFAFVFSGLLIALAIFSVVLEILTGISITGSVNEIGAVVGAALDAGRQFYKRYKVIPESGFAWRASFQMTLVELAISVVLAGLYIWFLVSQGVVGNNLSSLMFFIVPLLIFVFAISWVAKRYMFTSGARHAERAHLKSQKLSSTVFE
ncbi:hypothetical protein FMN63_18895 [Stappia sp. BW2]|uniref:ABZJ_00895 family protein n=1 Tax=Stappia sp. BW2 TaxID=2592622 RepID=UPI0011DEEDCF|nr:ABZJ_00895 family protein [Stappia sp. BW2]TYC64552.1 hypothetical protein FMN63_18895 [Stappia sp. BW2]